MTWIEKNIIPFCFKLNPAPMRFKELLNANKVYNDGMDYEHTIQGFKLRLGRTYLLFILLFILVNIPVLGVLHSILVHVNTHVLILLTAFITGAFFISFTLFKEYLIDKAARIIIKKAWQKHLSLFSFQEDSALVAQYYAQAIEDEIPIGDLQRYIFDKLSAKEV
ncbi:MAG: hypothetical protein KU37_10945 [Sulfuricurvum sp. PC08-66]|nr:MAG: hypothetical protein KU37_10945 [Sulfuricurvum sp. PC08-66]